MSAWKWVGKNGVRVDALEKILGGTRFGVDVIPDGCLHGRVIRSAVAHGRIRSIRLSGDVDWRPYTIVTARDIPGRNVVPMIQDDQPFLAGDAVKFIGEPILLLAHADPAALHGMERHIEIEYEILPAVLSLDDALAGKARLFGEDNVFYRALIGKGDPEAVFSSGACRVVETTYGTGHQEQLYLEPQNMTAFPPESGRLRVSGSLQCPYYVKPAVEAALGMTADVVQAPTGGAFGGKEDYPSLLGAWAALLAWRSGQPVRMVFERDEDFSFTTKRHPSRTHVRMAFDGAGLLQAMDVDFQLDGGAYCTLSPVVLSRGAIHAGSAYRCPNVRILGRVFATNTPPNGAFRGFGAPQAFFAIERHMDVAARELGLEPLELRRRNRLRDGDTTATSQPFVWQKNMDDVLGRALSLSGYEGRRREYEEWNRGSRDRKRGIGLALFFHGTGFTGSGEKKLRSRARVEIAADGLAHVLVANTEMGQGARTVLSRIVAESLDVPETSVICDCPDTARVPDSGPTVASRTTAVVGGLLEKGARALRIRLEERFGRPWIGGDDFHRLVGSLPHDAFPLSEEQEYVLPPQVVWDEENYRGHAYADYSWACYVAEVEADLVDYTVRPLRFVAVQDIGTVIHPELARGQVEGGVVQGLGYALYEAVQFRDGRVVNPGFSDYIVPMAADIPEILCDFVENPSPTGAFGAKGLGELPLDGVAPAVLNALSHATGEECTAIPVQPSDLFPRLEAKRRPSPAGGKG
jgi:CO/xanthine dehydrogenase Mo-binding subunit